MREWHGQRGWIWKEAGTTCLIAVLNGVLSKSSKCYSHFVELLSQLLKRFGVRIQG
jgi:hypothetical protein